MAYEHETGYEIFLIISIKLIIENRVRVKLRTTRSAVKSLAVLL